MAQQMKRDSKLLSVFHYISSFIDYSDAQTIIIYFAYALPYIQDRRSRVERLFKAMDIDNSGKLYFMCINLIILLDTYTAQPSLEH